MQFNLKTLTATNNISASNEVKTAIPRDKYIQKIYLLLKVAVSTAGDGTITNKDGTLLNLINNIKLEGIRDGDSKTIANIPFKLLAIKNTYERGVKQFVQKDNADISESNLDAEDWSSTSETFQVAAILDFQADVKDEEDVSSLLDAFNFSSLNLNITWGAYANVATGATTSPEFAGSKLYITLKEGLAEDEAEEDTIVLDKVITTDKNSFSKTSATGYEETFDLQMGATIESHCLFVLDNGIRSSALVSAFKVEDNQNNSSITQSDFMTAQSRDKEQYHIEEIKKGFVIIDYMPMLPTADRKNGDIKLKLNTSGVTIAEDTLYVVNTSFTLKPDFEEAEA